MLWDGGGKTVLNILILTTIGGFVPQFEMNDVKLLLRNGCSVHYASNFDYPVYEMDKQQLSEMGILMHPVCIRKSPAALPPALSLRSPAPGYAGWSPGRC